LPPGRIERAEFMGAADNAFQLYVNGRSAGGRSADPEGYHRLAWLDVTKLLTPGDNVLAIEASNVGNGGAGPNPAGLIGRLDVTFADGTRISLDTDANWRTTRTTPDPTWRSVAFGDDAWSGAKVAAKFGGGPWGEPRLGGAEVQVAEAWFLRKGDAVSLRPGIKWWQFKSANRSFWDWPKQGPSVMLEEYSGADVQDTRKSEVVDLTSRMRPDGRLDWTAPAGRWTVLRFGYTLLGQRTRCGSTVVGYEADMLTSAGIESQFKNLAEPMLAEAGDAVGRVLKALHVDSYEIGADVAGQQPTWCADFRTQFKARRGYDMLRYMPALAKRVVDGREITDRFLFDVRQTIADLMAERFFGRFAQLAHEHGVAMQCETGYGTYPHPHIDGMRCAGECDVPMGEFWHGTDIMSRFDPFCNVIRSVASPAHVYGHPVIQAESFTSWDHFIEYPSELKALGDEAFCDGLNRIVFHQYTHQPMEDVIPGWQYGAGTHVDRHVTWFPMAGGWFTYLARCQSLLQAGRFFADVCYYYGEGSAKFVPGRTHVRPALPAGFDFDCINTDALRRLTSVKDGRLALRSGMSYRVLVLPEDGAMSPTVLAKVEELLRDGAIVVGSRPKRAPSLAGHQAFDRLLSLIADQIWGRKPSARGSRRVGRGRVFWGQPVSAVLAKLGTPPDFLSKAPLRFIHRKLDGADAYFVSNQAKKPVRSECTFRMAGRQPELWDPVTGNTRPIEDFRSAAGRTTLTLGLAESGSCFVVFRNPALPSREIPAPQLAQLAELTGPWNVSFDPKWGGPAGALFDGLIDWTARPEDGIRHYSGTATYRISFDCPGLPERSKLYLDLGKVMNVARVRLNGKDLGDVWCAPWRVDVTAAIRPGDNRLEIEVANLWINRLVGDASLPADKRFTRTNVGYASDYPLSPSGLLGPVVLVAESAR
jgi:hypothetical protein